MIATPFVGVFTSAMWVLVIGAWLASRIGSTDFVTAIRAARSSLAPPIGLVIAVAAAVMSFCVLEMDNSSGRLIFFTIWEAAAIAATARSRAS